MEIADDFARALRLVGNKHRLQILRVLDSAASSAGRIAQELGLSRRTVGRHLAVLRDCGIVELQAGSRNGRLYAVNGQRAAMLSASFVSLMGNIDGGNLPVPPDSPPASGEPHLTVAPQSSESGSRLQSGVFVREAFEDLSRSLVKARRQRVGSSQMSSHVLDAQEEERKRIARELHDDTAQALTSALVRLRLLERSVEDEEVRAGLTELRDLLRATLEGVRRLAVNLRPPMLDDLGLEPALRACVQDFSRRWSVKATFRSGRLGRLPSEVELVVYRVLQETLSNVAKHAGASEVEALLTRRGRTLRMLIEDDGCGFDVQGTGGVRGTGLGLFGMEERLALIGGTLRVESVVGRGTRVSAEVPLPQSGRR